MVLKRVLRTVFFQQYLNLNGLFANSRRFKGLNMTDLKRWFFRQTISFNRVLNSGLKVSFIYRLLLPPTVKYYCLPKTPTVNKRDKNLIFNPKFQALLTANFQLTTTLLKNYPTKKYLKYKKITKNMRNINNE